MESIFKHLENLSQKIENKLGKFPSYEIFYKTFLDCFKELAPENNTPDDNIIFVFYEDFIKHNTLIGY